MASKYEISTIFKMIDNFTAPLGRITGTTTKFSAKVRNDMAKAEMQIKAAGKAIKTFGVMAAGAAVAFAGKTVMDGVKSYIELEDTVTKAGTKFSDLDINSEKFGESLEKIRATARQVGNDTQFTAQDAAGALDKFAMAGVSSEDAMAMLMGTTNLAVVAGTDLTTAVDIATDAMGIFQHSMEGRGITNVADQLNTISDVMAKASIMANTDLQQLFEGMTYAGSSWESAGQSIESVSGAIGILASAGTKGSSAGTALNAVFTQLGNTKSQKKLESMGVAVKDAQGNFRDFADILEDVERVTSKMGTADKLTFLNGAFRVQGAKAMELLLASGSEKYREYVSELERAGGTSESIAKAQMNTIEGQLKRLNSVWDTKKVDLGEAFARGGMQEALGNFVDYLDSIDLTPVTDFLTSAMESLPSIIGHVGNFLQGLWEMRDLLTYILGIWVAYKAAVIAALVVEKVMAFSKALQGVQAATTAVTSAQTAFNAAQAANPIGLIIIGIVVAIAAIVGLIVLIVKHWNTIVAKVKEFWAWLTTSIAWLWGKVSGFFASVGAWFVMIWEKVSGFFASVGEWFMGVIQMAWDGLTSFFQWLLNCIKTIGGKILSFLLTPIQKLLELMGGLPDWLGGGWFEEKAAALKEFQSFASNGFSDPQDEALLGASPVTGGERTSYSIQETRTANTIDFNVRLAQGLEGQTMSSAPGTSVSVTRSGSSGHSSGRF